MRRGLEARASGSESGQALILALGGAFVIIAGAVALVAIAGAVTGKGRAQRAADLVAISAARSMRDDLPRLLAPPTLPNGLPNPAHMPKVVYLARARAAALAAGRANGADPARVRISFPDVLAVAPLRVRARLVARLRTGGRDEAVETSAAAEVGAPAGAGAAAGLPATASGGGYGGPLVHRSGEGMRPDVAAAHDRMALAARADGVSLMVVSGFRSDAEQAALFAANPDPTWVAPPGRSLHRCATELDLGPASAYAWLAANASRFGFLQRYSWEAWHYGYVGGPEPCSAAGEAGGLGAAAGGGSGGRGDGGGLAADALPSFVPAEHRQTILAAAARWNVSAALLAGQLMAESGFDPTAGSPAGAQGIAQVVPEFFDAVRADPYPVANARWRADSSQRHRLTQPASTPPTPQPQSTSYAAG